MHKLKNRSNYKWRITRFKNSESQLNQGIAAAAAPGGLCPTSQKYKPILLPSLHGEVAELHPAILPYSYMREYIWGQTCTGNAQALTDHQEMAALPLCHTRDYLRGSLSGCCYRFCKAVTQVIAAFCNIILFCPLLNLSKDSLSVLYSCWCLYLILKKLWKNKSSK